MMREKRIYRPPPDRRRPRVEVRPDGVRRRRHPVLRVLPLLQPLALVNAAAVWGQAGWAHEHVAEPGWVAWARLALALTFALAIESIGVYLSWEAHEARMANQSAGLLQAGAYGVGALAGWLNFEHFSDPAVAGVEAQAITFAGLSAVSPWLWAVWSRARNRARLAELGQVDARGVKLSTNRKIWHPILSWKVARWAAWSGEVDPARAVAGWEATRVQATFAAPRVSLVKIPPPVPAVTVAEVRAEIAAAVEPILRTLAAQQQRVPRAVDPQEPARPPAETQAQKPETAVVGREAKRRQAAEAVTFVREQRAKGVDPTAAEVGRRFIRSESWGRGIKDLAARESSNGKAVLTPQ